MALNMTTIKSCILCRVIFTQEPFFWNDHDHKVCIDLFLDHFQLFLPINISTILQKFYVHFCYSARFANPGDISHFKKGKISHDRTQIFWKKEKWAGDFIRQ
jgi:hypothetical protein